MRRLLLVDDEPDLLKYLSRLLSRLPLSVSTANNGIEALEFAKAQMPDIIIMDMQMPEMNGPEAAKKIRELPEGEIPVIIFLAGDIGKFTIHDEKSIIIEKPINSHELIRIVNDSLPKQQAGRS